MEIRQKVIQTLQEKSSTKQMVFRHTKSVFQNLKEVVQEVANDLSDQVNPSNSSVVINYSEHGEYECRLTFSGDVLVFIMHTNVFNFPPEHSLNSTVYVKKDHLAAYCGVIHVYNFLSDSFKYQRTNDIGTMLARIFVNKDNHFFVEGDKEFSFRYKDFSNSDLDREVMKEIVCVATDYALEYDLQTPPFDMVNEISTGEIMQWQVEQKARTIKQMGYKARREEKK